MASLVSAASETDYPAQVAGVISDRPDAAGLSFAASRDIATHILARADYASREAHDAAIDAALVTLGAEIVCLAGYMRILTARFAKKWEGRMINIHPALLPSFKGLDTHGRALAAGARIHGCTVHFVTPETDDGPIIAQAAVPVLIGDTEKALASRVLKAEHHLYPLALRLVAEGKARMENGRTVFADTDLIEQTGRSVLSSPSAIRDVVDLEHLARITP
jgi:formyltetrahydrofolate-dependent phosphoribosylglycinamide formyltransferase